MKKIIPLLFIAAAFNAVTAQTSAPSKKDIAFIKESAEGAMLEVKLGQLAQTNALTDEVRSTGLQMATDHSKGEQAVADLASKKTIALPTSISSKQQKKYDKLAKLNGTAFDKKYAECMIKDHKKDICQFKREARKGKDPDIKAWAANVVPELEKHLDLWKNALKAAKTKPPARSVVSQ